MRALAVGGGPTKSGCESPHHLGTRIIYEPRQTHALDGINDGSVWLRGIFSSALWRGRAVVATMLCAL